MKRILVAGDLNVDLVLGDCPHPPVPGQELLAQSFSMSLGGAAAICAAGLSKLGHGVTFVGSVGQDAWGDFCIEELSRAGVECSRVARDPARKTGITVSVSFPADRALITYPGAIVGLDADALGRDSLRGFEHLHVSSYFLLPGLRAGCAAVFERARTEGLTTSLDPGFDPSETWGRDIRAVLSHSSLFFPNEVELQALTGCRDPRAGLSRLVDGTTRTVVKLGSAGAATLDGKTLVSVPAYEVVARDTTGAGDSFNAGFLHAWLEGSPLGTCLAWGAAAGALAVRGAGGSSTQGDSSEVLGLIRSRAL